MPLWTVPSAGDEAHPRVVRPARGSSGSGRISASLSASGSTKVGSLPRFYQVFLVATRSALSSDRSTWANRIWRTPA